MTQISETQALSIAVGADGPHLVQAGETYAPTTSKILALVVNEDADITEILDPNDNDVSGAGDDMLNVAGGNAAAGSFINPWYYRGAISGKYFKSITVNTGSVWAYVGDEKPTS